MVRTRGQLARAQAKIRIEPGCKLTPRDYPPPPKKKPRFKPLRGVEIPASIDDVKAQSTQPDYTAATERLAPELVVHHTPVEQAAIVETCRDITPEDGKE